MGTPTGLEPATFRETAGRSSQIELRRDIKYWAETRDFQLALTYRIPFAQILELNPFHAGSTGTQYLQMVGYRGFEPRPVGLRVRYAAITPVTHMRPKALSLRIASTYIRARHLYESLNESYDTAHRVHLSA